MLHIEVSGGEFFNEETNEFFNIKSRTLAMEHSLLSISKWEAKWKKPFLSKEERTPEEYLDYIRCMTVTPNVDPLLYTCLTNDNYDQIQNYIDDSHTATTFTSFNNSTPNRSRTITSELIYYWMIAYNIPTEYEKWHLNRLMTLIRICGIENNPKKKKMGRRAIYEQNRELNAARRAKYHTKG